MSTLVLCRKLHIRGAAKMANPGFSPDNLGLGAQPENFKVMVGQGIYIFFFFNLYVYDIHISHIYIYIYTLPISSSDTVICVSLWGTLGLQKCV